MESWKQREIPLHLVLRAIERSFDSYEARPRKRSVKTLLYCQEEVEAQFAEWVESRVGANEVEETEEPSSHFSASAISQHLSQKKDALCSLTNANGGGDPQFSETLTRAIDRLTELEQDLAGGSVLNARRLEDSLTSIERMLNDALLSNPRADVETVTAELKAELKSYRSQMDKPAYEQMLDNLLMKRLREKMGIPRLSLFYL